VYDLEDMEKEPKRRKKQTQPPVVYTESDADYYRELHKAKQDQWLELRELLQFAAIDVIKGTARLPKWGFVRLFSDIYTLYSDFDWTVLDNNKIKRVEDDIVGYNSALREMKYEHVQLLRQNDIPVEKLPLSPKERD